MNQPGSFEYLNTFEYQTQTNGPLQASCIFVLIENYIMSHMNKVQAHYMLIFWCVVFVNIYS